MWDSPAAVKRLLHRPRVAVRASSLERRVVWLFGSPRSGSTWLLNLLGRTLDAAMVDEPLIGAHLATPVGGVTGWPGPQDDLVLDISRDRDAYVFAAAHA